jgi:phenylacetate-CoA ligase
MSGLISYFDVFNAGQALRDYPIGADFVARYAKISRDELRSIQDARFRKVVQRAWQIAFYRRHWRAAGIEEGDIRGLEDLAKLPPYSKTDLMRSVLEHPPFGDFHGLDTWKSNAGRPPLVFQTTSGTTGTPQPLFYGPVSRELQNLMLARAYLLHGVTIDDVVHSCYGFGTVNAGHYTREAINHFIGAILITAGTGAETRSAMQVRLMAQFRATVLTGFADYVRKLAGVARDEGLAPGKDIPLRLICAPLGGESRHTLSKIWGGVEVLDLYGVGDTGIIAAEGPEKQGLHIWEDAHAIEIIDPETGAPLPDGMVGNICATVLFKDDLFPVVRFNTNDLSAVETTTSPIGWALRRLRGILGRSDNMVKLRGTNVYPTAIGEILKRDSDSNGEFLCQVDRIGGRDEMTVFIESSETGHALLERFRRQLREQIGVEVVVELVAPGALSSRTEIESRQKPIRLVDNRPKH